MESKNTPSIKISGKTFTPKEPKMKAWRKFLEFFSKDNEDLKNTSLSDYTDSMLELIELGFNREEVTVKSIEENLSVGDLKPLTLNLFSWLQMLFFSGIEEIPKNAQEAEEI